MTGLYNNDLFAAIVTCTRLTHKIGQHSSRLIGFSRLQRKGKNTKVGEYVLGDKRGHGRKNSGVNILKMHCTYACNCQRIKIFRKKKQENSI